jgi:hypothetical protein
VTKLEHWREETENTQRLYSPCMSNKTADRLLALITVAEKANVVLNKQFEVVGMTPDMRELTNALHQLELLP